VPDGKSYADFDPLFAEDGEARWVIANGKLHYEHSHEMDAVTIPLPPHIRLCERVEPEPISAQALQAAGWKQDPAWLYRMRIEPYGPYVYVSFRSQRPEVSMGDFDTPDLQGFPGVRTMADLAHLSRFLGADAPQ
jgi:hypothetical protein